MLTSIVLLMTVNTVATSAALFVALLAALDTGHRVATTDVAKGPARTAAFRTRRMESPMQHDRGAAVFFG